MLRLMQRLAIGLFAAGIFSFGGGSAWAFSQQTVGPGGAGNYTFADPDEHLIDPDNQNSGQERPAIRCERSRRAIRYPAKPIVVPFWSER